jgi:hypothetical protein
MGLPTHKWPMTMKEFASQLAATGKLPQLSPKIDPLAGQTPLQTCQNRQCLQGSEETDFQIRRLYPLEGVCNAQDARITRSPRKGGRPRAANPSSSARRVRRYRERKAAQTDQPVTQKEKRLSASAG